MAQMLQFFFSITKAQTIPCQEGTALLPVATGRIPREPYQRHGDSGERKHSQAYGAWEQEGDLFVHD